MQCLSEARGVAPDLPQVETVSIRGASDRNNSDWELWNGKHPNHKSTGQPFERIE